MGSECELQSCEGRHSLELEFCSGLDRNKNSFRLCFKADNLMHFLDFFAPRNEDLSRVRLEWVLTYECELQSCEGRHCLELEFCLGFDQNKNPLDYIS